MTASDSSMGGKAGQFHTTRWTLVMASAGEQNQAGQAALAALCQTYWYPLYAFARRRGYSPPDSQDLTQGFFLHLLEHRALSTWAAPGAVIFMRWSLWRERLLSISSNAQGGSK